MTAKQAVKIINAAIDDDSGMVPFSNGSEAECWMSRNCERCKRAVCCYDPDRYEQEINTDGGVKITEQGLNCFGEYAVACGFMTGKVPVEISEWMGGTKDEFPEQCRFFSDDDKDRPDMQPPPVPPNQLKIPFLCTLLFGFDDPNILVFDTAIIETDIYSFTAPHTSPSAASAHPDPAA
jgi:hypothetical protein